MNLNSSILRTVRPLVNVSEDDDCYDDQLIPLINLAIGRLRELGCGPKNGFVILGEDEYWSMLLGETPALINQVPTFIANYTRVNGFDMSSGTQVSQALKESIDKLEWTIKWECENYE